MVGGSKDQRIAHVGDVGLVADQAKEPIAVSGVAIHDSPNDHVVFQHKAAIDATGRITEDDILAPFAIGKIACAEQITARDLQLGRKLLLHEGIFFPHQGFRRDLGLIIKRRDKPEDRAVMFDAFAHGQNIRIRGNHLVIHMNALAHGQPSILCQLHIGADADGHDQQIAGQFRAVIQQKRADFATLAQNFLGIGRAFDGDAFVHQRLAQKIACGLVQLTLHQVAHDMYHRHIYAPHGHARCGL